MCQSPPFGSPVMFECLIIVRNIEPYPPSLEFGRKIWAEKRTESDYDLSEDLFLFFWSSPKSGQKNGLNLSENLCFLFSSFWSSCFSSGFYLPFQISGYAPGPSFRKSCVRHYNRGRQLISLGLYPARDLKHPSEIPYVTSESRWPRHQILL